MKNFGNSVWHLYGWAFGLPENFGSGSSGFGYFGFPKILPEISLKKEEPENSGTRKFGFGFGFTRITRISHTSHIKFLTLCIITANLSI